MATEKQKMLAGELYRGDDPQLVEERLRTRQLCSGLNTLAASDEKQRQALTCELFGVQTDCYITPPFRCDYGSNIRLGERVYFNFDCVILDVAPVAIGHRVLFGPGVHIYAATHPISAAERATGLESGRPVSIGDDVWVGGASVICPGVTIGSGSVIGAGSVVTKDVPAGVFAAGNPCRVIRPIE